MPVEPNMTAGWTCLRDDERRTVHVFPEDDLIAHEIDGEDCPCGPREEVGEHGNWISVHHSLDGREQFEPDHEEDPDYA